MAMISSQPTIGYLLKTFPKLSETFILNEMLELERQGLQLHIFSLRQPQASPQHPAVRQLRAPVTYIPSLLPECHPDAEAALLQSQIDWYQRDASRLLETMQFYCDRSESRRLNELLQGGYLAQKLEELKIDHLHVHFANIPAATAEVAQELCDVSYSITAHAKDIYLTEPAALNRRIRNAEFVVTCTDYNRRYLQSITNARTPIHWPITASTSRTFVRHCRVTVLPPPPPRIPRAPCASCRLAGSAKRKDFRSYWRPVSSCKPPVLTFSVASSALAR
jgi:hypothetical protein